MPFVRGWLSISHAVAKPLAALRISPTVVTGAGLVVAVAAILPAHARARWPLLAAVIVVISGLIDSLDGAVAIMMDRVSTAGALADAVADRLSDAAYGGVLWALGAPAWLATGWVALAWLAEYVRARAEGLGVARLDVVTVGERPTRIVVTAFAALGCAAVPDRASTVATVGVAVAVLSAMAGLAQLLLAVRRRLA